MSGTNLLGSRVAKYLLQSGEQEGAEYDRKKSSQFFKHTALNCWEDTILQSAAQHEEMLCPLLGLQKKLNPGSNDVQDVTQLQMISKKG